MATFSEANNSVIHIAQEIISKFHPHLRWADIAFIFRSEASKSGGKTVLSKSAVFSPQMQAATGQQYDFLVWISEVDWGSLSHKQQCALIDHELHHLNFSPDGIFSPSIRSGHDIEEFADVLERWGLWSPELFRARHVMRNAARPQDMLPGFEQPKNGKVGTVSISSESAQKASAGLAEFLSNHDEIEKVEITHALDSMSKVELDRADAALRNLPKDE